MRLTPLYHWAPAERYEQIRREGLRPGCAPTVASGQLTYLCLGPDPRLAWAISGAMEYCQEIEHWDLWQAHMADGDEMHVRPDFGPQIHEVKLLGCIPPDRLWWIGRRYDMGVPYQPPAPAPAVAT